MFLQGSFGIISPASLIQILCQEQRTVTITATRNGCTGQVWIVDGLLMGAQCNEHADEEAIYRLAQWTDGIFTVSAGASNAPTTMAAEADMVLLEAARRRDEGELIPIPPVPADLRLDQILSNCPALAGGAIVRSDGASLTSGMPETAPLVATSLAAIGVALGNTSGLAAYIGPGQRLLLTRSAGGHILLAAVRPGEGLSEAGAQIERVVSMALPA